MKQILPTFCAFLTSIGLIIAQESHSIHAWITDGWNLYEIELPSAKVLASPGQSGRLMTDIALSPGGQLYGVDGETLYTISKSNARERIVGDLGVDAQIDALEFRNDGILFGAGGYLPSQLYTVNPTTGRATKILTFPDDLNFSVYGDLVFDGDNNLYLAADHLLIQVEADLRKSRVIGRMRGDEGYGFVEGLVWGANHLLYGFIGTEYTIYSINPVNAMMKAVALQNAGGFFAGWRGATTDYRPLPSFSTLVVSLLGTGSGMITSSPAGIDCSTNCSMRVATGTSITLTAIPDSGSAFAEWGGSGSGTNLSSTVAVHGDTTVTARFNDLGPRSLGIEISPSNQISAGTTVSLQVTATGQPPLNYQWFKDGVEIAGANSPLLRLTAVRASDSGKYSVLMRNAAGLAVSDTAFLAVLADGANGIQTAQISAPEWLIRRPGKTNLVIVTHGWQPKEANLIPLLFPPPLLPSWVTNLSNAIQSRAPDNWQVVSIDWALDAWTFSPDNALANGKIKGALLGANVASQPWQHVHLLGHSAGAALIQAAADTIRDLAPNIMVHTTFLDPYLGFDYHGRSWYGTNAEWSDSYFAHDWISDDFGYIILSSLTEGPLDNAFNVNVTWADKAAVDSALPIYCPLMTAGWICGYMAWSSHEWPHEFYLATVLGQEPGLDLSCQDASSYGFPFSKEGGEWENRGGRIAGQEPLVLCGSSSVTQNRIPHVTDSELDFDLLTTAKSGNGVSILSQGGFMLWSGVGQGPLKMMQNERRQANAKAGSIDTAAWFAVGITTTNVANFLQFDAKFASTNDAQGLMTIYWNTNQIGMVDERVTSPEMQSYRFVLPTTMAGGLYTLSFRLDSYTNTTSTIMVTNVATGLVGLRETLRLGILPGTNGLPLLRLSGAAGYNFLVQSSTNLMEWTPTALLVNTNGTVIFTDHAWTNSNQRFYRAVIQ